MRLVCPNCEAKYEVPEDAIPETGRDVQCANCGHAWFQMRSRAAVAETVAAPPVPVVEPVAEPVAVAADQDPPPVVEPAAEPEGDVMAEAAPDLDVGEDSVAAGADAAVLDAEGEAGVAEVAPLAETGAAGAMADDPVVDAPAVDEEIAGEAAETEASAVGAMAAPAAYAVDESVLAILREEAERETQARRAEGARPLETQTDLGLDAAIPVAKVAEAVAAPAPVETEADDKLANRRTRLPDVEEINSTLRPTETADDMAASGDARASAEGRSSFRSGFLMVLTVAILGSALYGSADALAQAVPALAEPLKAYVGFVDSLRLHLDGLMQSATVAINGD